jgi:hypothetical protein
MQLQDHADDFTSEDRRDWLKALRFLEASLRKAGWPGPLPKPHQLLCYVGRIAANNFGCAQRADVKGNAPEIQAV